MTRSRLILPLFLVSAGLSAPCVSADEAWPDMFKMAVSLPIEQTAPDHTYEFVLTDPETGIEHVRMAVNTSEESAEQRYTLLHVSWDAEAIREAIMEEAESNIEEIWCDDFADQVRGDVALQSEDDTSAIYSFKPTDPDGDKNTKKVLERSSAELTIDKASGEVSHIRYALDKPFKPAIVAKVDRFELDITCEASSIGRTYTSRTETIIEGSALGQDFNQHSVQTIENLQLLD